MSDRNVTPNSVTQGPDESIAYAFNWAALGTPDDEGDFALFDENLTDISDQLSGSASINADVITSPLVTTLASTGIYYLRNTVTIDGNNLSSVLKIVTDLV